MKKSSKKTFQYSGLPVFGVSGWSGSGKTTLIEKAVRELRKQDFSILVVKHDVHGVSSDPQEKDSYRFFSAGADVWLKGPDQELFRGHIGNDQARFLRFLQSISYRYDLILIEGFKELPFQKVWLTGADRILPPANVPEILSVLHQEIDLNEKFMKLLQAWWLDNWLKPPSFACLFFPPNHLKLGKTEMEENRTFLKNFKILKEHAEKIVIFGKSKSFSKKRNYPNFLPDFEELSADEKSDGLPVSAFLSFQRFAPKASWFFLNAFDYTFSKEALEKILKMRSPGRWVIVPEPTELAVSKFSWVYCDPRARFLFETETSGGSVRTKELIGNPKVFSIR